MKSLYGLFEFQGVRGSMEDTSATLITEEFALFAVFDGHGGESCSQYCKEQVLLRLSERLQRGEDTAEAIERVFVEVDDDYCTLARKLDLDDGTTATVLVLKDGEYFLAVAGDSRAILVGQDGETVALSDDHKPDRRDERLRVAKLGGLVEYDHENETYRVFSEEVGGLAVTRAIGDCAFKPYVTAQPEIETGPLTADTQYIIMASDGLWDDVMNDEAGDVMNEVGPTSLDDGVKELVHMAFSRGSEDNITCLSVNLQQWMKEEEKQRKRQQKLAETAAALEQEAEAIASKRRSKRVVKKVIPGLDEDGYLSQLLLWKNPVKSMLWLTVGCQFFFLSYFADYSVLTLGSYLVMMQILIKTFVVKAAPLLVRVGLVDSDFDSTVFVLQGTFFSDEVVKRAYNFVLAWSQNLFSKWNVIVHDGSATNVLGFLRLISYLFSPFPLSVVLFILFLALFSLPATYQRNQDFLDRQYQKLDSTYQSVRLRTTRSMRA